MEHPTEERIVGSIFKGRIQNLENGLQAAFVDYGGNHVLYHLAGRRSQTCGNLATEIGCTL